MIPDDQYNLILKTMPIFCVDWLVRCRDQYLLLERTQQPLRGSYWIIGGRLRLDESVAEAAQRLQLRELGRYCGEGEMIGFSNYRFPKVEDARATHTPAVSYVVDVEETFEPVLGETESSFIWTPDLPEIFIQQTEFIDGIPTHRKWI